MTDATGHMDRPGAGSCSSMLYIGSLPTNLYINYDSKSGRVELARPMPPGTKDVLVRDFPDVESLREWAMSEHAAGRIP